MSGNFSLWKSSFIGVHVSACMYVYAVLVCVNTCLLQCAHGSQRKPLVIGTCIPSSLRQGLLVVCCYATYARLDGLGASGIPQDLLPLSP